MRGRMKERGELTNVRGREVEARSFLSSVKKKEEKEVLKAESAGFDSISDTD